MGVLETVLNFFRRERKQGRKHMVEKPQLPYRPTGKELEEIPWEAPEGVDILKYGKLAVPRTVYPGDTFQMEYVRKLNHKPVFKETIVEHNIEKKETYTKYVVFAVNGAFGSESGIGGAFLTD